MAMIPKEFPVGREHLHARPELARVDVAASIELADPSAPAGRARSSVWRSPREFPELTLQEPLDRPQRRRPGACRP